MGPHHANVLVEAWRSVRRKESTAVFDTREVVPSLEMGNVEALGGTLF